MHVFDILNNREIHYYTESIKLLTLFNENEPFSTSSYSKYTLFDLISTFFRKLDLSKNYISYEEFLKKDDFISSNSIESFCLLCEKILSLLSQMDYFCKRSPAINTREYNKKINEISKVIAYDLEKAGFVASKYHDTECGDLVVVYPRDEIIMKAIEADANIADMIIDYSRPSIKGNLKAKEECLHFIIKSVEHIAQDKSFKYPKVAEQAEVIFNMFHIRHDNIRGKKTNVILPTLSDDELEKVFDMGYRLALELLVLNEFQDIDSEVDVLRKMMKQGKQS